MALTRFFVAACEILSRGLRIASSRLVLQTASLIEAVSRLRGADFATQGETCDGLQRNLLDGV
jgi:hypothetical protein